MNLTNLKINDLIKPDAKLTFLVGAGCSVDAPSCQPAGRKMMDSIIKFACAESEIETIMKLEDLRFEALVEILRDSLDSELKVIDYYGQCDKPNIQHFFLAEMILKGHFVMTTNFDFLIEHALIQSNIPKEDIKVAITKADFETFNNPNTLVEQGKKALYKVHGSTQNIISGEKTKDSLITTLQAFGSNKEGLNVFQVEPFKQALFKNISEQRSLIIMGYSGSDDFDIVPTLKVLKNIRDVIWINFIYDDGGKEVVYEIEPEEGVEKGDKINQILKEIKRMNYAPHVYRIDTNTSRMIKELIQDDSKLSTENFSLEPIDWLRNNIVSLDEYQKYYIPGLIYKDFNLYEQGLRCQERVLKIAEDSGNLKWKAPALNNIAMMMNNQSKYPEALQKFEEAMKIAEEIGDTSGRMVILNHIGSIYKVLAENDKAIESYEASFEIAENSGADKSKAITLNNIGDLYAELGRYNKALRYFEKAKPIIEKLGDLRKKAILLNNMGNIHNNIGNNVKAVELYKEALSIADLLGDNSLVATLLNQIGLFFESQGNYDQAFNMYVQALKLAKQIGKAAYIPIGLNNLGEIYRLKGNYNEALKMFFEALRMDRILNNPLGIAGELVNITTIFLSAGHIQEAKQYCEEAITVAEEINALDSLASSYNSMGIIYFQLKNYQEALQFYEKSLNILIRQGFGESPRAEMLRNNIDSIKTYL